jgi:hypothetical protein
MSRATYARVPRATGRLSMRLIPEMVSQLNLERSLNQPLRQLAQQPARANDLLLGLRACQQLVNNIVRKPASDVIRHALKDPRRGRRRLAQGLGAGGHAVRDPR